MNFARRYRKTLLFLSKLILFSIQLAIFVFIWRFCYTQTTFHARGNYLVALTYALVLFLFSRAYGAFNNSTLRQWELIYSSMMALVTANILTYLQLCLIARILLDPLGMVSILLLQAVVAIIGDSLLNRLYFRLYPAREVAMVCSSYRSVQPMLQKVRSIRERYRVCAVIETRDHSLEDICRTLAPFPSVLLCDVDRSMMDGLLSYCYGRNMRTYILPTVSDIMLNHAHHTQIFDTPVFLCKNRGPTAEQLLLKRAMDIVISLLALIVTSPFMLITAAAIKLYDKGPVMFKQQRMTQGGRIFWIYKFRSMIVDADADGAPLMACEHDNRITPVGRIIRRIRFDELPQFINILKGDMSIVGPRPERIENVQQYTAELPEFEYRLKVKAGLTGYAQVYGKYNTTPRDKLSMDLLYIENYSLLLDLKLLIMTLKILFIRESTEGIADIAPSPDHH